MAGNEISGCNIAQNDRNQHIDSKLELITHETYSNYENLQKKSPGVQNSGKIFYVIFGFLSF